MHARCRTLALLAALVPILSLHATAEEARPPEQSGLVAIGDAYFLVPKGSVEIALPASDFETGGQWPQGWVRNRCEVVTADDAPQGNSYCRMSAANRSLFRLPAETKGQPGQPNLLSFWVKSPARAWASISFTSSERLRSFGAHYPGLPATDDQWKRVGYYFLMPTMADTIGYSCYLLKLDLPDQSISFDDVRLRTATWDEMSAAYEAERAKYPEYDDAPRVDDGKNLALSVVKWEGRGVPGKPFLIWAVGSSWTNFQGDGYPLIRAIRERFPAAPPIIYKKHAGSGTPWDFARGWVRQFVIPQQPDLVLTYTNGTPAGLEQLILEVRRQTTADIMVPSLHFFQRSKLSEQEIERGVVDWAEVRAICKKHQVEFVENRRELAAYLERIGQEPPVLVGDAVHQNAHGRVRIWDNIVRHIARHPSPVYDPQSRERRLSAVSPPNGTEEEITVVGQWKGTSDGLTTQERDARIRVRFRGNRLDLIGKRIAAGGTVKVVVDGTPGDEVPVFFTNFIKPAADNRRVLEGPGLGDVAPHAVSLGENVAAQSWTITMASDQGDYRLEGNVTGLDGQGNALEAFTSSSGQVLIDPELWRHTRIDPKTNEPRYANRAGDTFQFDVYRCCDGQVSFQSERAEPFFVPLVQNLKNGSHTVEIIASGDGDVTVDGFYVYEPPLQEE